MTSDDDYEKESHVGKALKHGITVGLGLGTASFASAMAIRRFYPQSFFGKLTLTGRLMSFFMPAIAGTFINAELELERLRVRNLMARQLKKTEAEVDEYMKKDYSNLSHLIDWYITNKFPIITAAAFGSAVYFFQMENSKKRAQSLDTFFNSRLNFQAFTFVACIGILLSANLLETYRDRTGNAIEAPESFETTSTNAKK